MYIEKHIDLLNKVFLIFISLGLLFFANEVLFFMSYLALFVFVTLRTLITPSHAGFKRYLILSYTVIVVLQIIMVENIVFSDYAAEGSWYLLRRFLAVAMLLLPILVSRFIIAGKYSNFSMPSAGESFTIAISALTDVAAKIRSYGASARHTTKKLRRENLMAVLSDIPRHDSFNYINNGSLTKEYFSKAAASISDPNIYLVISKTGSPASEIISAFTGKHYNHASLSFDRDLQTTISYNGGAKVYPPGLNMEMIEFFSQSPDAKILVYSLPCPAHKKQLLLDKIAEINTEGSAYNMLGLLIHRSYKPNIMFCSQFVYKMIDYAGLSYFSKRDSWVSPTDLIELDYYKKLKFEKEIN